MNTKTTTLYQNICGIRYTWVFATPDHSERVMFKYNEPNTILIHLGKWHEDHDEDVYFDWEYSGSFTFKDAELDINNMDIEKLYTLATQRNPIALEIESFNESDDSMCDECEEVIVNKEDGSNICAGCMAVNFK